MIDALFWAFNAMALAGWTLLIGFPGWTWGRRWIVGLAIPASFAVAYLVLFAPIYVRAPGGFGSISQLVALLSVDPAVMLAAWLHFLTFDLLIGRMILEESRSRGMPHVLMITPLLLCFMFGPVGWLAHVLLKRLHAGWR